ncbi:selB: selenocysteine-specific translation elongation factor [Rubrobacter radiotolerans]|uniref:Selenocysteine-specific translation elongation factor n=1 Tax=Rubrobacter radiotolerans TaxID=42256 RepID=A0A023X3V9_RUBRA|nr:selenocysteine-specific translation elongation factor [Rubrobacter radiotolerans]AHY47043.1 selB: selenocysteine-specific translation elongation factor [Rubrobacter radiotolerans]MDX5894449.1 selenocysteine-specific translation elongation factor [Rubrobacter radiotolerans]SMC06026.1 selenocysteine-specific translation elongation factor SelB [Rubrobacter radiotolerans DSM 5868]
MAREEGISLTIGTAGHVDHGKTTLVRYLTGTDTDRLEEEHRRGISIVPGYAELVLPGGRRASLVDVPGHERFVKNMVAGSSGVDAFLLAVAADDGVMPQTREHLDVLRVLGVERGVVALTKVDAVDEESVEIATLDVEELLESVGIEAGIYPVSGLTGEGVPELLAALDGLAGTERAGRGDLARLPVDRSFVLKGIGVVVTGTLWSGEIRPGDMLVTPSGKRPRVRSVQNHGRLASVARAGARTALDLVGVEASEVPPGDVLLSRPVPATRLVDVRLRVLESAKPIGHGTLLRLHHGTRDVNARIRLGEGEEIPPGGDALARLRLDEPLVLLSGDRFVVRSLTPPVTIGGGTVLDPDTRGRGPDREWLRALEGSDLREILPAALAREPAGCLDASDLALRASASVEAVREVAADLPDVTEVGGLFAERSVVKGGRKRLLAALEERARKSPERPELSVAEARVATGLPQRLAEALISAVEEGGKVVVAESGVRLRGADEVPPELEAEAQALLERLWAAGTEPPTLETSPALRLLLRRGAVVELGGGLYGSREAAESVLQTVKDVCNAEGSITLAGFRDRLGTSRKFSQAWLEYADLAGVTVRTGDERVLTRRYRKG